MNYILSDLISRLSNAYNLHLSSIKVLKNNMTLNFLVLLYKQGLIRSFFILRNQKEILVYLKYKIKNL